MKNVLAKILLGILCCMALGSSASGQSQIRIATVDLNRVFTNYWKTKQADAALQELKAELTKSDKELIDTRQKAIEAYNKLVADANNQAVSTEEREKRKKAVDEKVKEIRDLDANIEQFEKQARTRLTEQSLRMRDNLLAELRTAITAKAKAGGYSLLLDTSGQTADRTPIILFSTLEDVTDSVLAQLNAGAPITADEKKP